MAYFTQTSHVISAKSLSKIKSLTIRLFITDCTGEIFFTDMFLQGGTIATGWVGHVSEIQWTLDG
ncbi:hypothetical protein IRB23M11_01830 [Alkalibacterium sp. m-11]|uniref:Uncharacterized protein n=1 Tax=Alkalibacterium indicireducens TaxID=398758 RepID=A0ABN1B9J5_9LACT